MVEQSQSHFSFGHKNLEVSPEQSVQHTYNTYCCRKALSFRKSVYDKWHDPYTKNVGLLRMCQEDVRMVGKDRFNEL